jgi:hypothetical protein
MTKISRLPVTLLTALLVISFTGLVPSGPALAGANCSYGEQQYYDETLSGYSMTECVPARWEFSKYDDGFDTGLTLSMDEDSEGWSELTTNPSKRSYILMSCFYKRLSVSVRVDYPDSVGFNGSGRLKIDNGSAKSFDYTVSSPFDYVTLASPKKFTQTFVKADKGATFQIFTLMGVETLSFPIGDLANYQKEFANAGCSLGTFPKPKPLKIDLKSHNDPIGYCVVNGISDQAIGTYGINRINWTITSQIGKKKPVLLDKFAIQVQNTSLLLQKTEPQKNGMAITLIQDGFAIYTYTPEKHRKGEKFTCSTSVEAASGSWAKQSTTFSVKYPRAGYSSK